MKHFGFTSEANHGKTNNEKKHANSDNTQISRPDLRFASRENSLLLIFTPPFNLFGPEWFFVWCGSGPVLCCFGC